MENLDHYTVSSHVSEFVLKFVSMHGRWNDA